jgi:sec-independent protein translocase protein TatA
MILFLNSIGGAEIILIMLFILMFFGSKSIPGIARTLGKGMREIQHASNEIRNEIKQTTDQIKKDALIGSELDETIRTLERRQEETISKINSEIQQVVKPVEKEVNDTMSNIETTATISDKQTTKKESADDLDTSSSSTNKTSI